jgi:PEGA domain
MANRRSTTRSNLWMSSDINIAEESYRRNNMSIQLSSTTQRTRRALRHLVTLAILGLGLFSAEQAFGQGVAVLPQGSAGRPVPTTCLILERVETVDKVTSRVLSLGIHGKQFQYIEGQLPEGSPFRDKLTERDVSDLQSRGSKVVIVNSDLMPDELQQARDYCRAETRKTPVQVSTTQVEIASTPSGSDIELDGKFVGSTPSSVNLASGEHTVKLSKNGYATWERKITTVAGSVRISPELEPAVPAQESPRETSTSLLSTAGKQF